MSRQIYDVYPDTLEKVAKISSDISGRVFNNNGPVSRELVLFRRHDQTEVARTFSDPSDGTYSFTVNDNEKSLYRVMAIADDLTENSQVLDHITPMRTT